MQRQEGKANSEPSPRRLVRSGGIVAVAVMLSAAAGLLAGWLTAPRASAPSSTQGLAVASEAGPGAKRAPQEPRSSPDKSRIAASLSRERLAIEWSVASCLGKPRPQDGWAPRELLTLYEARDGIAEMLANGIEPKDERRLWLELGTKVATALDDRVLRDAYQNQLDAIVSGIGSREEMTQDKLLLRAARLVRGGRDAEALSVVNLVAQGAPRTSGSPFLAGPLSAISGDREVLVRILRSQAEPGKTLVTVQQALQEARFAEAAVCAWLALELEPDSDDAERLKLALGQAIWWMGDRRAALEMLQPLTRIPWDDDVRSRSLAMVRTIESELALPADELEAVERFRINRVKQAERDRLDRQRDMEWRTRMGMNAKGAF